MEARRKGQVPKSANLTAAILLSGAAAIIYVFGAAMLEGAGVFMRRSMESASLASLDSGPPMPQIIDAAVSAGRIVWPALVIMFVIAIIEQVLQVGWFISVEPLKPKLSKLNFISGAKRLFSKRSVVKAGIDVLKVAALAAVVWLVIRSDYDKITALTALTATGALVVAAEIALHMILWALALLLLIGLIDRFYQKWQHTEDLKMTKQEVKDERRSMEGDTQVKARRLKMARELVAQQLRSAVPKADVIVTNPTHFAVALKYDADSMNAPRVVAKGADYVALQIRLIAASHGVPMVERPPLARALYHNVDIGREIPAELYEAVAEVLAYVYRLEGKMAS